jgi:hypothetical protein
MAASALARFGRRAGFAVNRWHHAFVAFAAARRVGRFERAALNVMAISAHHRVRAGQVSAMAWPFEHFAPWPLAGGNFVCATGAMQLGLRQQVLHDDEC